MDYKDNKGFRIPKLPTKGQMKKSFNMETAQMQNRIENLAAVLDAHAKIINGLRQQIQLLSANIEMCDYRSLATMKKLIENAIFTSEEHEFLAEKLQIDDFNEQSEKQDRQWGLIPTADGYQAKRGDSVVLRLWVYKDTGELMPELSPFRFKIRVGEGRLKIVEDRIEGVTKGQIKEEEVELGKGYGEPLMGKKIKVKMEIFDIKTMPVPKEKKEEVTEQVEVENVPVAPALDSMSGEFSEKPEEPKTE